MWKKNEKNKFIGNGWAFPPDINTKGEICTARGYKLLEQSIRLILETVPGERESLPDFGCSLNHYVFSPNTALTRSRLVSEISEALTKWEPRVEIIEISADSLPGEDQQINIHLQLLVREDNSEFNMVYPFYLEKS